MCHEDDEDARFADEAFPARVTWADARTDEVLHSYTAQTPDDIDTRWTVPEHVEAAVIEIHYADEQVSRLRASRHGPAGCHLDIAWDPPDG